MEDMNTILGIAEEKQDGQSQQLSTEEIRDIEYSMIDLKKGDNNAESILSFVAYTILVLGLIISAVLGYYVGHYGKTEDGWTLFFVMAFACSIVWASSMILINISNNLKNIKYLLARQQGLSVSDGFDATATKTKTASDNP